jgi:phosphomannomutase
VHDIQFGTDGWRGVIAEDFTDQTVSLVSSAIARYIVRATDAPRGVLVGYDNRFGSERFARLAAQTIAATGTPVWLTTEPCPSPAISLLVRERGAAGGVMITASHNPPRWNGIKFKAGYGSSALPSIMAQIEAELRWVERQGAPALPPRQDLIHKLDFRPSYLGALDRLVDWERVRGHRLRLLVDPMHGAARGLLCELLRAHGVSCEEIRGTRDPLFGGVNPEPIEPHIGALQRAVRQGSYDAGLAADGDGDRIGAVDRQGHFVTPHQVFSLLLWHLAGTRAISGDVAKTFSSTKMLDKIAAKYGRKIHEVPIGFKYICELMLQQDILLGGEESGGIGTKLHLPERDATVTALYLVELMAWQGRGLGELVRQLESEFGEHHYARLDLELQPGQKQRALELFSRGTAARHLRWNITRREQLDGIKLYLDDLGWLLVRASGTEPILRLYAETSSRDSTRQILDETAALVHNL